VGRVARGLVNEFEVRVVSGVNSATDGGEGGGGGMIFRAAPGGPGGLKTRKGGQRT
jgi:hypothetical protein